jgi:OPA family glycerol-3-phosphate transporter-like MFS transporter 3
LRGIITGALFSSSIFYSVIILLGYLKIYIPAIFVVHWALEGLVQSAVWPGIVAIMSNWFDKNSRGKLFGFWSSCDAVGNILGAHFGNLILIFNGSWMEVILPFGLFQVLIALIFLLGVRDKPEYVFHMDHDEVHHEAKHGISFWQAVKIPGVIAFSLNYACIKFLYYGLSMWLPYFLDKRINKPDLVGLLVSLLDFGGIFGGIVCGWLGDRLGFKSPVIVGYLVCALPLVFLFQVGTEDTFWIYFIVIPIAGFFIVGAANIVSSAVGPDLVQNPELHNKDDALATVTGIVDGTGGIGAAIGVLIMGLLSTVSWLYVFLFMVFMGFFSILCLLKIAYLELKKYRLKKHEKLETVETMRYDHIEMKSK